MVGIRWKEVESQSGFNTGVAAAGREAVISGTQNVDSYNRLNVTNRDVVDVEIELDGDNSGTTGKSFQVTAGGSASIDPEDGIWFTAVWQKNLHASTAETANKIQIRAAKAIRVDY